MDTTEHTDVIDPKEWRVRGSLRHEGLTYGPADPLPPLTLAEAERYESLGNLVRLNPDGSVQTVPRKNAAPPSAAAYLYARDEQVFRSIVEHRPSKRVVQEILSLAKQNGRSYALRFALEAILLYAGVKSPHADLQRE